MFPKNPGGVGTTVLKTLVGKMTEQRVIRDKENLQCTLAMMIHTVRHCGDKLLLALMVGAIAPGRSFEPFTQPGQSGNFAIPAQAGIQYHKMFPVFRFLPG